jgi:hypothetical protein
MGKEKHISVRLEHHIMDKETHRAFLDAFTVLIREVAKQEINRRIQKHVQTTEQQEGDHKRTAQHGIAATISLAPRI